MARPRGNGIKVVRKELSDGSVVEYSYQRRYGAYIPKEWPANSEDNAERISSMLAEPPSADDLYVMRSEDGRIKIGRSVYVEGRRRDLQNQTGLTMVIIHVLPGRGYVECELLSMFRKYRCKHGEWFDGSYEMLRELKELFMLLDTSPRSFDWVR